MHDKAFEKGYFSLSDDYQVLINEQKIIMSSWAKGNIETSNGQLINIGIIKPSKEALRKHRLRTKLKKSDSL